MKIFIASLACLAIAASSASAALISPDYFEEEVVIGKVGVRKVVVKQQVVRQVQVAKQVNVVRAVNVTAVVHAPFVVQNHNFAVARIVTPFIPTTTVANTVFATPTVVGQSYAPVQQFAQSYAAPCQQQVAVQAVAPSFQFQCGCPQSAAFLNTFASYAPAYQTAFFNGLSYNQQLQFATVGFSRGIGVNFFVGRGFGFSAGRAFRRF